MDGDRPFWRSGSGLFALGVLGVVVVADTVLRNLGGSAGDFTLFLGRFHPLAVHLPIGIVLLVGAAELATLSPRLKPRLDPAIGLALPILVVATAGAFVLGHLLARSGDFAPRLLAIHRRVELFAAVGICLCPLAWAYQERRATVRARWAYRALLGTTLTVLATGAHFGGSLTHGESYLTHYAPGPLRGLLGASEAKPAPKAAPTAKAAEPRLFADVIEPLFEKRCASCHGPEKAKGGLRLDSLAAILKGGEDGTVVTPGVPPDSALVSRMLLPEDDDDHMPPEGKPGLTPAQIALVRFWVERGANDNLLVKDLRVPAAAREALDEGATDHTPTAVTPPSPSSSVPAPSPASPPSAAPAASARPVTGALDTPARAPGATRVLAQRCEKCHGASKQKSKLRVDSVDALLRGGKTGPAVVAGNPRASELMKRLQLPLDDEKHMPPSKEPQLEPSEVAALASFIAHLSPSASRAPAPASPPPKSPSPPASALAPAPPAPASPDATLLASLPLRIPLYPTEIAPLLASHCRACHSGKNPAGGLAMEPHASLLSGGNTGPAVTPGKPKESVLVTRVSLPLDDGDHMPPEGEAQLSAEEIALIVAWIERDGSEQGDVDTATLPAAAVRAIAAHPPGLRTAPSSAPEPEAPPPRSGSVLAAQTTPPGHSGGCAACAVAALGPTPDLGSWLLVAATGAVWHRRRRSTAARHALPLR